MAFITTAIRTIERAPVPDLLSKAGIRYLVERTRRSASRSAADDEAEFVRAMDGRRIALNTDAANAQHYELPPEFFGLTLGRHRKYSCCLYPTGDETLEEAELAALEETVRHADVADGQNILELGCGWGSLSLFLAERFPRAMITSVSNSTSQRRYIEAEAARRGLGNLTVLTADMNEFEAPGSYDRVISVEMFEHMSNWRALLQRIRRWLKADGRLFIHVFTHRKMPYRFDDKDPADWIARHFFTGGIMPSHGLIRNYADCFTVEREWRWNGGHYQKTALHWLDRFDGNYRQIEPVLRATYGRELATWRRRWRLFFLATAGLFGHSRGEEWGVSHYLLRPAMAA